MKYLSVIAIAVALISTFIAISLFIHIRQLECDIGSGFTAERQFAYPMFRELGKNPDEYGKGFRNPFLSSDRYFHCAD